MGEVSSKVVFLKKNGLKLGDLSQNERNGSIAAYFFAFKNCCATAR